MLPSPSGFQAKPVGSPPHNFSTAKLTEILVVDFIDQFSQRAKGLYPLRSTPIAIEIDT
jgi:hypothetical protein